MDLKTFVSEVITQVGEGILDAQEKAQGRYHVGNIVDARGILIDMPKQDNMPNVHAVAFDIAVVVQGRDGTQKGGEISIPIVKLELGGKKTTEQINEKTSRVMFSVPVVWPSRIVGERKK